MRQVSGANLNVVDGMGWCLRFTQSAFASPVAFPSARKAWDGQQGRHFDRPPMGVAVPIWFDHWGTYGSPAEYGNWGHVAVWLGDGRVLTSPLRHDQLGKGGVGQATYPSIEAMQRDLGGNPTYLGWSEYMNGKQIAAEEPEKEKDPMPQSAKITFRPKTGREIKSTWTYLTINDKGDVTVLGGGSKGRKVFGFCNLEVNGVVDVRAVVERTSQDGTKVLESRPSFYSRVDSFGTYSIPLDIPAGWRLRYQARAVGSKTAKLVQVGYSSEYWEK